METATIQWTGEQKFLATSPSGHAVPFDSDRESNKAPGPMEMVLMALGACTATDIVIILVKKRQKLRIAGSNLFRRTRCAAPQRCGRSWKWCIACEARWTKMP